MKNWLCNGHLRRLGWAIAGLLLALSLAIAPLHSVPLTLVGTGRSLAVASLPLIQQGQGFYQAGQYTQAEQVWQRAATDLAQRGDVAQRSLVLSYLALAHHQLGQGEAAEAAIATSLQLWQNSPPQTTFQQQILGQVLNTQGNLQFSLGQIERAIAAWQGAADAFAAAGDEPRRQGSLINRAQAEQSLGLYLQARRTLEAVAIGLAQQPVSSAKVLGLQSLGNVWRAIGQVDQSQQVLAEAVALVAQLPTAEQADILAGLWLSLGNTAQVQQNLEDAAELYAQAATTATDPLLRVQAQLNQLRLQRLQDEGLAAAQGSAIAATISELPEGRSAIYAQINYADLLSANPANDGAAAQQLANAVQQAQRLQDQRAEAYALGYLANLYEKRDRWPEAQSLTEQALRLAQSLQAADVTYRWQWQLGRILKAQNQTEQAIATYNAAFVTLQSLRRDLVATGPDLQFSFREGVEPLYREFLDLLLVSSEGAGPEQLALARQVIEALRLAELDNFFRTACLEGQSVALDAVDQTATAVIHPIVLEDRLEIILSLPNRPLAQHTVPVGRQQVEAQTTRWLRELGKPLTSPQGKALGAELYGWLIAPLAAELAQQQVQTLVFVLDGALRNIPMAALYDGDRYLIETYQVALAPGLQLLNPQPLRSESLAVLAAGLTEARHGFSALSNVGAEIETIRAKATGQVLLDQGFTTQTLQTELEQTPFPVVHLATHGQFSSNLDETFVLAWDRPILLNELRELLRSRDDITTGAIELLVLSACETAAGDSRATLGLAGIAVEAGSRSTLASLWNLDDQSGAEFMGQFYQALVQPGNSKAAALQEAQLALLQDSNYRHPRYWAPYVLLGNWL
ncbi:CHAT domain-containing protein [Leptolyngbya sp. CCNP1308]|uniref:CHAT domain-containing protein n=1 Tax=Leptolyngbya sp. CCNP1308 TaxID=3110255 RepID=UPI002B211DCF|nr:CHAT domain-containing protein [Leptolyngbya sp. CCNP1308]MEA5449220.1 CHAT domain-containing protein [Leptolyngbya sp. CCNP1308]